MIVIGLTGFAGAGKSTAAQYLVEKHGFIRVSFAAPLKKMLHTLDPILGLDVFYSAEPVTLSRLIEAGWSEQKIKDSFFGSEYRRLLQVLGTDCIRAVDQDFWVKAAVAQMTDPEGNYVFDDVRFPNEAEVIKGFGTRWNLWYVARPGYGPTNGHSSEAHAGNMGEKFQLNNGGELAGLHDQIDFGLSMSSFEGVTA